MRHCVHWQMAIAGTRIIVAIDRLNGKCASIGPTILVEATWSPKLKSSVEGGNACLSPFFQHPQLYADRRATDSDYYALPTLSGALLGSACFKISIPGVFHQPSPSLILTSCEIGKARTKTYSYRSLLRSFPFHKSSFQNISSLLTWHIAVNSAGIEWDSSFIGVSVSSFMSDRCTSFLLRATEGVGLWLMISGRARSRTP